MAPPLANGLAAASNGDLGRRHALCARQEGTYALGDHGVTEVVSLRLGAALTAEQGDLVQAMREVVAVLTRQPWNEQAKSLEKKLKDALPRP